MRLFIAAIGRADKQQRLDRLYDLRAAAADQKTFKQYTEALSK